MLNGLVDSFLDGEAPRNSAENSGEGFCCLLFKKVMVLPSLLADTDAFCVEKISESHDQ